MYLPGHNVISLRHRYHDQELSGKCRDGVLEAMALASRTTDHVLGLGGQVLGLGLGRRVLGLGLGKHVLDLDHFRLMCPVLCTLY